MLIMVYMFISPLEWAFNLKSADTTSLEYAKPTYLVILEVVLEVFFVLDVYIHFRTGYTNKNDETVGLASCVVLYAKGKVGMIH